MRHIANTEQLQRRVIELEYEVERLNAKLEQKNELLQQSISKSEHEKLMERQKREYEMKLSAHPPRVHNERGAGRKPKLTDEIKIRILALHGQRYSQMKTARAVSDEFGVTISRSTVGNIIRSAGLPKCPP